MPHWPQAVKLCDLKIHLMSFRCLLSLFLSVVYLGSIGWFVQVFASLYLYRTSKYLVSNVFLSTGFGIVLFSLGTLVFHRRAISKARLLVLEDKAKYDEIWAGILRSADNDLQNLKSRAQCILGSLSGTPRQINRKLQSLDEIQDDRTLPPRNENVPSSTGRKSLQSQWTESFQVSDEELQLLGCGIPGTLDIRRPVDSLDQLYYQAAAVHPILVSKVQKWASVSQGCFQTTAKGFISTHSPRFSSESSSRNLTCSRELLSVRVDPGSQTTGGAPETAETPPPGFVAWEAVRQQGSMLSGQVRWCSLKSVQRSLEKSTRSYGKVNITCFVGGDYTAHIYSLAMFLPNN